MNRKRIILAGGSGFIGRALAAELLRHGCEVVLLTRSPRTRNDGVREFEWDGQRIGEWIQFMAGAAAIVNLTGKNINCPHTPENVRQLAVSRVDSVNVIAGAFAHVKHPPPVWIQAGAIGFYGNPGDTVCDESSPAGTGALADVCCEWEKAFAQPVNSNPRKVLLRIGFVLGRDGGALPVLARLTKWFLGGAAGDGRQFISWIHLADVVSIFLAALERENISGIYNAAAPASATNADFMRELRRVLHRPWSPPAPEFAVKLGARLLGSEPSLALDGCRCVPKRFLDAGFTFQFRELAPALNDLFSISNR